VARFFVDTATVPTLVVPRLVTSGGTGIGVWTGAFGRGAYFSNVRYARRRLRSRDPAAGAASSAGWHPARWEISKPVEAEAFSPSRSPTWGISPGERVAAEPEGFVLVNRYREAPVGGVAAGQHRRGAGGQRDDRADRRLAHRVRRAPRSPYQHDELRRLQYTYSNGVVVYLNGRPLAFAMNPGGLRGARRDGQGRRCALPPA
jgi:hypothetical protein